MCKLHNANCGVAKSVAAYQHNILSHPAYLLSFLGAGPGIRDPGSGMDRGRGPDPG